MTELLHSGPAAVAVDPEDGGRLTSLTLGGRELIGFDNPVQDEPPGWFYGSFPMAPFAGRLKDGQFHDRGVDYIIPPNCGPHAGHGLVFDVPWRITGSPTPTRLALETEFDDRWPFGGRVEQTFQLSDSELRITLTAHNDTRSMPVALGFHPWFKRDIGTGGRASFQLSPGLRYSSDPHGALRILTTDLGARPWDDVFTNLEHPPTISWPSGPRLRLTSNTKTWVVSERLANAFCIEPITAPPGTIGSDLAAIVAPGEPLELWLNIEW